MRKINTTKLTKNNILSKISQESIFAAYFNISIDVIKHCIDTGELICSPIREDKNPTCGFKYDNKGKLKFRDFSGLFWGDCFDAVATVLSVIYDKQFDISNKYDFIEILRHITFTFKDIYYGQEIDPYINMSIVKAINIIKRTKPIIEVVVRDWNDDDKNYWKQFGISLQRLNINFVYPIEQYYINRKTNPLPKYYYNKKDPCYAYNLGTDNNGINNIKIYFPNRSKGSTRFITNNNILEGIYNLDREDYDIIIITKSTKDRLAISCAISKLSGVRGFLIDLNIGVINIPHETYKLRQIEFKWLFSKLSENSCILSLMDNDTTGINEAIWLKSIYSINNIFIPKRYNCKDFADFVKNNSTIEINKIINIFINYFNKNRRYELYRKLKENDSLPY